MRSTGSEKNPKINNPHLLPTCFKHPEILKYWNKIFHQQESPAKSPFAVVNLTWPNSTDGNNFQKHWVISFRSNSELSNKSFFFKEKSFARQLVITSEAFTAGTYFFNIKY